MYPVSELWLEIVAHPDHTFKSRVKINIGTAASPVYETYSDTKVRGISTNLCLFSDDEPTVGSCLAGEISVQMYLEESEINAIPRMAEVIPEVQAVSGEQESEWIPQGHYFIDTRETAISDGGQLTFSIHGYDAMLKTEGDYPSTSHDWPANVSTVVNDIATAIGAGIDLRTLEIISENNFSVEFSGAFSMREVLSGIAARYAGNWVMNYDGELLLVRLAGIPKETRYLVDRVDNPITFGTNESGDMIKASGNPASFSNGAGDLFTMIRVTVPVSQSGSGTASPSNVRAFVGYTSATFNVSATQSGGESYSMSWSDTLYGGYAEVVNGTVLYEYPALVITNDNKSIIEMISSGHFAIRNQNTGAYKPSSSTADNIWSNVFRSYAASGATNRCYLNNAGDIMFDTATAYSSVDALVAGIPGITFVYKARKPVLYQIMQDEIHALTQEIPSLEGQNYVWSNRGSVDVVCGKETRILV